MQVGDLTPKYFVLDLEVDRVSAGGGDPKECVTQIAVIDPSRPKAEQVFNRFIKPPKELRKGNWREKFGDVPYRMVTSFKQAWPELVQWINSSLDGDRQAVIVMHNGYEHDWPILSREVARQVAKTNQAIPKHWKPFDTLWLKNALRIQGDGSVSGLCHTLGVEVLPAHDAVNDVVMTNGIFEKMVGDASMKAVLIAALDADHPVRKVADVIRSMVSVDFAIYDFESDGLFPKKGQSGDNPRATQLAIYLPRVDQVFDERINTGKPIPREASAVHHIYDEDVKDAPDFKAVWLRGQEFIQSKLAPTANKVIVMMGHNVWGYDNKLYEAECERTGLRKERFKSFDTLALARSLFKGIVSAWTKGFFKQEYMAPLLGVNVIDAHDARGDVIVNWRFFQKLVDGCDPRKVNEAIVSGHPVLALAQLIRDIGVFDPRVCLARYEKACGLTKPLAQALFTGITNGSFFEPNNLAAILDINVEARDKEPYVVWRAFLKMTDGLDRGLVNEALNASDPLSALAQLCTSAGTFNSQACLETNKRACEIAIPLAKELMPGQSESFYQLDRLARTIGVAVEGSVDPYDTKRIFMEMTKGLDREEIARLLANPTAVQDIGNLVRAKGTFYPEKHATLPTMSSAASASPSPDPFAIFSQPTPVSSSGGGQASIRRYLTPTAGESLEPKPKRRRLVKLADQKQVVDDSDDERKLPPKKRARFLQATGSSGGADDLQLFLDDDDDFMVS